METQVEHSGLLSTPFGQALSVLALPHLGRDQICSQVKEVFHRLATQPKSTQVERRPLIYY